MYAIVFDYDKTIGYFEQIYRIFILCNKQISIKNLLTLFPNVFRPLFFNIIEYIINLKKTVKIILYTNNNGPRFFIDDILSYIDDKFKRKVFDYVIYGYKTNDGLMETCRKNKYKRFEDLMPCTGKSFKHILFLDDSLHNEMIYEGVEYLQIEPYYYDCIDEIDNLELFLNNKNLQNLKFLIKKHKIPKSCDNNENIQIFKAVKLYFKLCE